MGAKPIQRTPLTLLVGARAAERDDHDHRLYLGAFLTIKKSFDIAYVYIMRRYIYIYISNYMEYFRVPLSGVNE